MIQAGGLAVWLLVLLALAGIVLMIIRGIAWRLVEYNKGVTAALSLIVVTLIGSWIWQSRLTTQSDTNQSIP